MDLCSRGYCGVFLEPDRYMGRLILVYQRHIGIYQYLINITILSDTHRYENFVLQNKMQERMLGCCVILCHRRINKNNINWIINPRSITKVIYVVKLKSKCHKIVKVMPSYCVYFFLKMVSY